LNFRLPSSSNNGKLSSLFARVKGLRLMP